MIIKRFERFERPIYRPSTPLDSLDLDSMDNPEIDISSDESSSISNIEDYFSTVIELPKKLTHERKSANRLDQVTFNETTRPQKMRTTGLSAAMANLKWPSPKSKEK